MLVHSDNQHGALDITEVHHTLNKAIQALPPVVPVTAAWRYLDGRLELASRLSRTECGGVFDTYLDLPVWKHDLRLLKSYGVTVSCPVYIYCRGKGEREGYPNIDMW